MSKTLWDGRKEAIAQIEKALAVTDGMPPVLQEHAQPITRDLYGSLLTQTGEIERAEEELRQASASSKGQYDFSIAAHFGYLRFRQKRYDEAREHYQELSVNSRRARRFCCSTGRR